MFILRVMRDSLSVYSQDLHFLHTFPCVLAAAAATSTSMASVSIRGHHAPLLSAPFVVSGLNLFGDGEALQSGPQAVTALHSLLQYTVELASRYEQTQLVLECANFL